MASSYFLRHARRDELPVLARILMDAFKHGPWSARLFPERLRVKPGDADDLEWRVGLFSSSFDKPEFRWVVAIERQGGSAARDSHQGNQEIVGWAQWVDGKDCSSAANMSLEDRKKDFEKRLGSSAYPPALDREAFELLGKEGEKVEHFNKLALGEERTRDSWLLNYLTVRPDRQRRGLGRLLLQWGIDKAQSEDRDIRLRSSLEGRPLYLAMGFEEVGRAEVFGELQYAMIRRRTEKAKHPA